ncbi:FmdB family zinc ribbon protein [Roseiflexus castenholzii]|jgi:putative FmdB family regulatory protein|uniref:Putative regulatory protein, FmdB family n=1 Tax=Roseiflexus castenholzii (strain DSM 13941 / HLO8) TaxID=383372 RepID=A7NRB9_ROSCS|nr:zinc ribbon domain-containing protein [Roseiflexus castenholzii]ABU60115.1 putative regulatory protein, FmdB family [Roseiflexus castenholzii DSM 13941]
MPLYEYQCSDCAREFDALRPIHRADEIIDCPACGSRRVQRKISIIALKIDAASPRSGGACCGGSCGCASRSDTTD